jgi:hypothetical protein
MYDLSSSATASLGKVMSFQTSGFLSSLVSSYLYKRNIRPHPGFSYVIESLNASIA